MKLIDTIRSDETSKIDLLIDEEYDTDAGPEFYTIREWSCSDDDENAAIVKDITISETELSITLQRVIAYREANTRVVARKRKAK